jgi:hypothetical protein
MPERVAMPKKFLLIATATCLILMAVSCLMQSPSQVVSSANSLPDQALASRHRQIVLNTINRAQSEHKTISGLYAGGEKMFRPHWWDGAPSGSDIFDQFVRHVEDRTGEMVGIVEVSFTGYDDEREYGDLDRIVNLIERQVWERGAIPAISDHMPNPWNGADSRNKDIGQFDDLFNPGSEPYARFHRDLEFLAEGLHKLQDRGIPVLLRLFHENTGGWFWWGRHTLTPEQYQRLWRYTVDYFESSQGLENLIWVYGPSTSHYELIPATYPGDEYVDIVGISNYGCDPGRPDILNSYFVFKDVAPDKPFAFTELGPERDGRCQDRYNERLVQVIDNTVPEVVYFLNWFGPRAALALYPNADDVLQHPDVWNADDLVEVGRSP